MLSYSLSRSHAGMTLIGDYTSLRWVHDTVHAVNERSVVVTDKEGPFLGLAYDVRKAFERQREILPPPAHMKEVGIRYGVRLLWPTILLQQRTMRVSLAYFDHSRRDQAVCYALEAVIEEALVEDFGPRALDVIAQWRRIDPSSPCVLDRLHSRGALFCSWSKADRKSRLAELLASFDPMYETLHAMRVELGSRSLVAPADLERWKDAEWPDPRW